MPYDPVQRRYIPDIQAPQVQMPGWVPMDDQNDEDMTQNIATIGGAFRDRFNRPKPAPSPHTAAPEHGSPDDITGGHTYPQEGADPHLPQSEAHMGGPGGGARRLPGGGKSLG